MHGEFEPSTTRTTTEAVFDQLCDEIRSLKILPGTRISEAETAKRLGVSRQPVRDAFTRLAQLDLLLIRPQRPTIVRGFSIEDINNARFVRQALELEVVDRASGLWTAEFSGYLQENLTDQEDALNAGDTDKFHALDFEFHKRICECSGFPLAYDVIKTCKQKVDRLCMLSLGKVEQASTVLDDHRRIADALASGCIDTVRAVTKSHLKRLDETVSYLYRTHANYFDEDPQPD